MTRTNDRKNVVDMALGGDGPYMVAVLWSLTGLILFFLFLRLYTRIVCVAAYGIDDHFYVLTCVSPTGGHNL